MSSVSPELRNPTEENEVFIALADSTDLDDILSLPVMPMMERLARFLDDSSRFFGTANSSPPSMTETFSLSASFQTLTEKDESISLSSFDTESLLITEVEALALTDDAAAQITQTHIITKSEAKDRQLMREEDCQALGTVLTQIHNYNPLPRYAACNCREFRCTHHFSHNMNCKFVPILEARGGTDKCHITRHRRDSIPIAECIAGVGPYGSATSTTIQANSAILQYIDEAAGSDAEAIRSNEAIRRFLKKMAHGVIVRVNPGTLSAATQAKLDAMLSELAEAGVKVMSHPDVKFKMGAKDALVKIRNLKCGLSDTAVYYEPSSFYEGFRKSIAFRPRVIKQNRGSQGEGIWICKLKDESKYCEVYGESVVSLETDLVLMEANDNHVEYHTVEEFLEFCVHGRTDKAGHWASLGNGKYFEGGYEAGAMLVDQRFLPRITEGEIRCLMIGQELIQVVQKVPKEGGLSATLQSGATYTTYSPDDPKFSVLVDNFKTDLPSIMSCFGLDGEALPLLWTADYIYGDTDEEFYVGEFNCSCVGITQQLEKSAIVARVALETVFRNTTDCSVLSCVLTNINDYDPFPKYVACVCRQQNCMHHSARNMQSLFIPILEARGGTDKCHITRHRRDSIPIAECIAGVGPYGSATSTTIQANSAILQYIDEAAGSDAEAIRSNEAIRRFLKKMAHGVIVRVNPGTLSAATQAKLDAMLSELAEAGVKVMSHPDVKFKMGAKDALVKIRNLKCGLSDTAVYYEPSSFYEGFRKSIAFRPRVIKQNRGSQGEGIWICKLKDESKYCEVYGESVVSLETDLVLMEANDNHVEYHTVEEFLEFCVHGRTDKAGHWASLGNGKYFEGGYEAGAMLVDQRFLPRITEGEIRCLMIGQELIQVVQKVPKEGGLSATLQSGATYTTYSPDDPKFSVLVDNFKTDLPSIMSCFGLDGEALPLLWTADYIYGDTDEEFYVGEFNCSCVGITQQLEKSAIVARVALETVFRNTGVHYDMQKNSAE